jgi:hypothetical protein
VAREAFVWAPFIALGCGVVAGLGVLHSPKRAFTLAVASMLLQLVAWKALFMIAGAERRDEPGDWNPDLYAGFFLGLVVVTPYTVIGAAIGGAAVGLLCRKVRFPRARV